MPSTRRPTFSSDPRSIPMILLPIVGAHYRPPAKALIKNLPVKHPLLLLPEPTNEHDPFAISISLDPSTVSNTQWEMWDEDIMLQGSSTADLIDGPPIHLGYVPRDETPNVHEMLREGSVRVQFVILASGNPGIALQLAPKPLPVEPVIEAPKNTLHLGLTRKEPKS